MDLSRTIDLRASMRRARTTAALVLRSRMRLPPRLTMSEWAERHRVISPPAALHGKWRNDRAPYGVEIMDTISGTEYQDITVVAPSQAGKTELAVLNPLGYFIDQQPSSILIIQPTVEAAMGFSKERVAPMIRDTPRLRGKVSEARSRTSDNTILQKHFAGGFVVLLGANSPTGLASRPIRIVIGDEFDRWTGSAGTEGDPWSLAVARTKSYRHRAKRVKVSSPGNAGESRMEKEWKLSDQRHLEVPCPHCTDAVGGELAGWQVLEWRDTDGKPDIRAGKGPYRLVWEKTADENGVVTHDTSTVAYECRFCHALIEEHAKPWLAAHARWVKHNPRSRRAGFHIPALLMAWERWQDIADRWLAVKEDAEERKAFFNTTLGLLYTADAVQLDAGSLSGRREAFAAEVPGNVGVLTASIDVQGDRLELAVWGWGANEESWLVYFERLVGDPEAEDTDPENVWVRADAILNRQWRHESGATLSIKRCAVDAGYLTDRVYKFTKPREPRGIYAVMGSDALKGGLKRHVRTDRDRVKRYDFNPTTFKEVLFPRLGRAQPGPGYIHFGTYEATNVDEEFLKQFSGETRQVQKVKGATKVRYIQVKGVRNEAIDLAVMGLVALRMLGPKYGERLGAHARRLWRKAGKGPAAAGAALSPAPEAEADTSPAPREPDDGDDGTDGTEAQRPSRRRLRRRGGRRPGGWGGLGGGAW
jgi:phage terminase large subunit GpA-like protein